MLSRSISHNSVILTVFALITAGVLALTFLSTKERIAAAERRAAAQALLEIVPRERHDNDLLAEVWPVPAEHLPLLGLKEGAEAHIALLNGEPVAVILPSLAPDGYSGDIKLIIGINVDGTVAGVRVLSHKETPGLGDKIDLKKHSWILGFNGKSLDNPAADNWTVKKDGGAFDQFTGATITPRAVVRRVKQTLDYFAAHRDAILTPENEAQP